MSDILSVVDDGVATVTLNRPAQRNAMTFAMWNEVGDIFKRLDADHAVRAIILTGAGEDFSAGADIGEFAATRDDIGAKQKIRGRRRLWLHRDREHGQAGDRGLQRLLPRRRRTSGDVVRFPLRP